MRTAISAAVLLFAASCATPSTGSTAAEGGMVTLSGTVEVLAPGSRSETIILQVDATGEVVALVGEEASALREMPGVPVTVTGRFTDVGWSMDPDIRKLQVTDTSITTGPDSPDRYED